MTKLNELIWERKKLTEEIYKICAEQSQSNLEIAKQYIGRCFSYNGKEYIKIVECRFYGDKIMFDVLSFSNSRVDEFILQYWSYEFSSIIGNEKWKEISISEFVKFTKDEVWKLLEE